MCGLVEPLHQGFSCELSRSIERDLARHHRQPGAEIVASEAAKPAEIVFEEQEPEVAEHIVHLVVGQHAFARGRFANGFTQPCFVKAHEVPPSSRIAREHCLQIEARATCFPAAHAAGL